MGTSKVLVGTVLAPQCKVVTTSTYTFLRSLMQYQLHYLQQMVYSLLVGTTEIPQKVLYPDLWVFPTLSALMVPVNLDTAWLEVLYL